MALVLGISASLRNARTGSRDNLAKELGALPDRVALEEYLRRQTSLRVEAFLNAGRAENKPFTEIYENLRRNSGEQGLSNSEAAAACGLWGALQQGADIEHVSLARYFPASGRARHMEELRAKILQSDALLISGPVYFGDRGSLAQSFIEFCSADREIREYLKGRLYAGIAVGAKRNGGQETTLIYQMLDMANLSMLAVGNSSDSTSQYGGTAVAGDVGRIVDDAYGIETCIGTGTRLGSLACLIEGQKKVSLKGRIKVHLWLLQDSLDGDGYKLFRHWCDAQSQKRDDVEFIIWDLTAEDIVRCIACDVCPVEVGPREEYRCIITAKKDFFVAHHAGLIDADAVLLCAYSPQDRSRIRSVYQSFMERTRYIRRDNYLFSNILVAPFVISELMARQNLHLRMLTSMVRHHTVVHHPIIGLMHNGAVLNAEDMDRHGNSFIDNARRLITGVMAETEVRDTAYNPIGYVISNAKTVEDKEAGRLNSALNASQKSRMDNLRSRLTIDHGV
jgi:multimeric flavodoxin WrbA